MRNTIAIICVSFLAVFATTVRADLLVEQGVPKIVGQKAIVSLALKNTFPEKIQSARAAVFLLDEQGKMVGQSAKWVIGGSQDKPGLEAGATNAFFFVITSSRSFTTSQSQF
jgi:hypothetical protein